MKIEDLGLDDDLRRLWVGLQSLRARLRDETWAKYRRVNPFGEDLLDWKEKGRFVGGRNVTVYDSTTVVGDVTIGDNTWVGPFCSLDGTGGLEIGSFCALSLGTQLITHDTVRWALSGGRAAYEYAPVRVGDCCFLGVHSVVTRGVSVGDHSLVAAGAVVTKDVEPYSIVAGVPARRVGAVRVGEGGDVDLDFFGGGGRGET
ncbi:MAG TPA: acyltransferase [Pyrinomonadaceae bacterium]|jgi:acetyltransferase-like isoleucine patch superfamily enzyme